MDTLLLVLAIVAMPILIVGFVYVLTLEVRAEYDPDAASGSGNRVSLGTALAAGAEFLVGAFFIAIGLSGDHSAVWVLIGAALWLGAVGLLRHRKRETR